MWHVEFYFSIIAHALYINYECNRITTRDEVLIDWEGFQSAAKGSDNSRKRWLSKCFLSECCGVGKMIKI